MLLCTLLLVLRHPSVSASSVLATFRSAARRSFQNVITDHILLMLSLFSLSPVEEKAHVRFGRTSFLGLSVVVFLEIAFGGVCLFPSKLRLGPKLCSLFHLSQSRLYTSSEALTASTKEIIAKWLLIVFLSFGAILFSLSSNLHDIEWLHWLNGRCAVRWVRVQTSANAGHMSLICCIQSKVHVSEYSTRTLMLLLVRDLR